MEDYKQRRQREAAQTEQAILQAAMRLCRQKAFDKVSVREICSLAGITTGAFYHHFPSKEALLAKGFSSLDGYVKQALAGHENQPPEQRLVIILTSYADFMEGLGWELAARYYQQRLGAVPPAHWTLSALPSAPSASAWTRPGAPGCCTAPRRQSGLQISCSAISAALSSIGC